MTVDERIAEIEAHAAKNLPSMGFSADGIAWLVAELRSARKDSERLDRLFGWTLSVTLPVHDGSVGEDFRLASRDEIDAQVARCAEYEEWPAKEARQETKP